MKELCLRDWIISSFFLRGIGMINEDSTLYCDIPSEDDEFGLARSLVGYCISLIVDSK
jgi:hypothetical protein